MLVKVKFANIINIAANEEIIPELLQSKCNAINIYNTVEKLLSDQTILENQVSKTQKIIKNELWSRPQPQNNIFDFSRKSTCLKHSKC